MGKPTTVVVELERFRLGSKKNKVYSRFVQFGVAAARKYGLSVSLKPTTLNQWLKSWDREGIKPAIDDEAAAPAEATAVPAKKATPPKKKVAAKKKKAAPAKKKTPTAVAKKVKAPKPPAVEPEEVDPDTTLAAPIIESEVQDCLQANSS